MPTDHTITIDIKNVQGVDRITADPAPLNCHPSDRITWKGTANVGRWAVAFLDRDRTPFDAKKHYFTAVGGDADGPARVTGATDDYDYYIFCAYPNAQNGQALFLDPKIVIQDAPGPQGLPEELRAFAGELEELMRKMDETARTAEEIQDRAIQLAREIEERPGVGGPDDQGEPVPGG